MTNLEKFNALINDHLARVQQQNQIKEEDTVNLIKVSVENDRPTVSARELHQFLEVDTPYRLWFPRMAEYGFVEGTDYTPYIFVHPQNHQEITDQQLTIDMAKEICMIQRTEKGKQARQYFIQLEKDWNSPEKVMARALRLADQKIQMLTERIQADAPKVLFADAVAASETSILIGELAKLLKQNGVPIGQNKLFEWMRQNGYLIKRKGTDYNMPTQKSMELGLFFIKETTITHSDGHIVVTKTPKVSGRGQTYFVDKFLGRKMVDAGE